MSAAAKPFRVTGWHVLFGVTGFFLIIIALDVWFAALALKSFPGETASNPYEAGIAFNQTLAKREAEARLGWKVAAAQLPDGVRLEAADAAGRPLEGLTVTAKMERPATEQGRKIVKLTQTAPGVYEAHGLKLDGAWDLTATLRNAKGEVFEAERRLQWL